MKKAVYTVLTILVIAAVIGGGYGGWRAYQSWQAQKTWLDEQKLQTQAVLIEEDGTAPGRTVLSKSQQKEVVNLLKELPDPFSAEGQTALPAETAKSAVVFHFANRDTVCYVSNGGNGYVLTAYENNAYHSVPVTKEQYDAFEKTVSQTLSHKAKGSFGLRHWVDWKPTHVTGYFKEAGTRVMTQEEVYSITRLFRLRGVTSQDARQNYLLRSTILVGDLRMDLPWAAGPETGMETDGSAKPDIVITLYYPNGFIKLLYFKDMANSVFVLNDSETGVYDLDVETSEIYLGTMNEILAESQRKAAEKK